MSWEYKIKDQIFGPVDIDEIKVLYNEKQLTDRSLVRHVNREMWQNLNESDAAEALGIKVEVVFTENGEALTIDPDKVRPPGWRYSVFASSVIAFCVLQAMCVILNAVMTGIFFSANSLTSTFWSGKTGQLIVTASSLATFLMMVAFCISAVAYAILFQRAMKNIRLLGATDATVRPFMVWLWHFVPFASLVMPFRAMSQIWFASHRYAGEEEKGNLILGLWWGSWLFALVGGRIFSAVFSGSGESLSGVRAYMIGGTISSAVFLTCGICLFLVGKRINQLQKSFNGFSQAEIFS